MEILSLQAVGDVKLGGLEPEKIYENVAPMIRHGDVNFCQLESPLSERGSPNPAVQAPLRRPRSDAPLLKEAGFNVVSLAGNHCLDYCQEALFDTIQVLTDRGMRVVGVGETIEQARRPVIVECKGTRLGFLAYNSILHKGYVAETDKPGCCPLRVHTVYEPFEYDQPGQPAIIHTFAYPDDLRALVEDIKKLRSSVDIVVISMHWGLHFVRAKLARYQRETGHAAIDAGADIILGHHAHILKGVEVYRGKVIFYSLGNFIFPNARTKETLARPRWQQFMKTYDFTLDEDWLGTYAYPAKSRNTMMAKCTISEKKIKKVSFLPARINKQAQPYFPPSDSGEFKEVLDYVEEISQDQGLDTKFNVDAGEVIICT